MSKQSEPDSSFSETPLRAPPPPLAIPHGPAVPNPPAAPPCPAAPPSQLLLPCTPAVTGQPPPPPWPCRRALTGWPPRRTPAAAVTQCVRCCRDRPPRWPLALRRGPRVLQAPRKLHASARNQSFMRAVSSLHTHVYKHGVRTLSQVLPAAGTRPRGPSRLGQELIIILYRTYIRSVSSIY
jgi:hypothetical protein